VISHDRALLRRVDRIVELSGLGAQVYGGGYDLYAERKAQAEAAAARDLADAERAQARAAREAQAAAERKARRDSAGRRGRFKAGQSKMLLDAQAQRAEATGARQGRIAERLAAEAAEALADAESRVERVRRLAFELPPSGLAAGKTVLALEHADFAYPGAAPVLADVSLRLVGPERVAVTGGNGRGKTTLLKLAAGELSPTGGRIVRGGAAAFLDQQTVLLRENETLVEAFRRLNPAATPNAARAALARFLFRNTAADKPVAALSGGERLRAALACVLMAGRPPQLLILDEPTNHLDLDSIAAVEQALAGYDGALMIASHDRDFLDAVGVEREVGL
jgi:ATPase subunit of ABC transporter with duplicated ATPase domains